MGIITAGHIKKAMESETYSPQLFVIVAGADGKKLGKYPVEFMAPVTRDGILIGEIALEVCAPDLIKRTEYQEFSEEKALQGLSKEYQKPKEKAHEKLWQYIRGLWR